MDQFDFIKRDVEKCKVVENFKSSRAKDGPKENFFIIKSTQMKDASMKES